MCDCADPGRANDCARARGLNHTRAAVCAAHIGERDTCPRSRKPVSMHVHGLPCPLNRFPDARGVTRRFFARWHGVNAIERRWLAIRYGDEVVAGLAGCGCIVGFKRAWRVARVTWWRVAR